MIRLVAQSPHLSVLESLPLSRPSSEAAMGTGAISGVVGLRPIRHPLTRPTAVPDIAIDDLSL